MTPCKLSPWGKLCVSESRSRRAGGAKRGGKVWKSAETTVAGCSEPLAPGKGKHCPFRSYQPAARDLRLRCVCSSLGPPLAYIFPVPPRVQGRRQRAGDCGTVPGAGREPAELGEEPPRPRAEHAAPACSARVHPARRGGDRAEAVASGRCLGPDPLHVSLAWGHVHRLSPVRRPDVLRINKMKLEATGGQIAPVLRTTIPNRATSPLHRSPTAAPPPGRSPPSKLQPRRAPARPRPLAGPGALCRSH
ncbi:uncharacterized protein [Equus przewalskii]|uniref:Uncharacterized protein isoform X3 n=1 Tax=Equus przewalskii TaxID=9798 RepID=A0ABM4KG30_EQUPR